MHPFRSRGLSLGQSSRSVHCWACEELLAIVPATGRLLLEADATLVEKTAQHSVIDCRCGERTVLSADEPPR